MKNMISKADYLQLLSQIKEIKSTLNDPDQSGPIVLAVSKNQLPEKVERLYGFGHRDFGENYVNEAVEKIGKLDGLKNVNWHFIGQVQSNKIKKIVENFKCIHSVSRYDHCEKIAKVALNIGKVPFPIYISVNMDNEVSKSGLSIEDAVVLSRRLETLPEVSVQGLMCVPRKVQASSPAEINALLVKYQKFIAVSRKVGVGRASIGMSGDYEYAVAAGSDCVRLGTVIFGSREKPD